MPLQITFVINARHYLGKIFSKSDKNKNDSTSSTNENINNDSSVNKVEQECFVQYGKSLENQNPYEHNISTEEELGNTTDEDVSNREIDKGTEKQRGYFKKLFSKKQINETKLEIDPKNLTKKDMDGSKGEKRGEPHPEGTSAIDTFNAILNSGQSLSNLVGKEFTLTTPVTVQAVENVETSEPNILLKGTIPFKYATAEGIRKRKVHVSGRICKHTSHSNLSKDPSCPSISESSGRCSLTKVSIIQPQKSLQFPVNWKTAHTYQKQDYIVHCGLLKKKGSDDDIAKSKKAAKRQMKESKKQQEKDKKKLTSESSKETHRKKDKKVTPSTAEPLIDVPISSITITRSRTRFITYSDGTEYIEKCGKETITLKAPKGMYFNQEGIDDGRDEEQLTPVPSITSASPSTANQNALMVKTIHKNEMENPYTRDAYFFVRNGNPGIFPYEIFEQEYNVLRNAFVKNKLNLSPTDTPSFIPNVSYPPNDYSEILEDRYNPLTWIYKSYNKTKNFVRGFSVQE